MPGPLVHALISLNEPAPRCGAAGLFLAAALHPAFVTCPECLKAEIVNKAPGSLQVESGVSTPAPGGDRVSTDKGGGKSGVSEKVFRQEVVTAAKAAGWMVYFSWTSIHSPAGFPDLVLVKPPLMLLVELKTDKGKVTKSQRQWLEALAQVTEVVRAVWKPTDLAAIRRLLGEAAGASRP